MLTMQPRLKLRLGLTAKTVIIAALIVLMATCATLLTSFAFDRLSNQLGQLSSAQLEQLMNSVRLVQQSDSLARNGLILAQADTHDERRLTLVELTGRMDWIRKLTSELARNDTDNVLLERISETQERYGQNVAALNALVREHIDHPNKTSMIGKLNELSSLNRELAGELSVLMGYFSTTMRNQLVEQTSILAHEIKVYQRNLLIVTVLLLISAIAASLYFQNRIVRRIVRLQRAVEHPEVVPADIEVGGNDEITQLADAVGSYVQRIQAQELKMKQVNDELAFLAEHDPLTQLANRRHFDVASRRLIMQSSLPLCVAIGDIDFFKRVNDEHGHAAGDLALICVAKIIQSTLRNNDILARFGGEEFSAILAVRSLSEGQEIFEHVRQDVEKQSIPLEDGTILKLTISFGIALIKNLPMNPVAGHEHHSQALLKQALHAADKAMYEAKHAGRNRVSMAPTPIIANTV